jgi:hypothetical protein
MGNKNVISEEPEKGQDLVDKSWHNEGGEWLNREKLQIFESLVCLLI